MMDNSSWTMNNWMLFLKKSKSLLNSHMVNWGSNCWSWSYGMVNNWFSWSSTDVYYASEFLIIDHGVFVWISNNINCAIDDMIMWNNINWLLWGYRSDSMMMNNWCDSMMMNKRSRKNMSSSFISNSLHLSNFLDRYFLDLLVSLKLLLHLIVDHSNSIVLL
jgi:hypothetical protein